jgi:Fuc2NAc and GlcNAc transferase
VTLTIVTLLLSVFAASLVGNLFYPRLAMRLHIHAVPNYRSLHPKITPRGAGIVVAAVNLAAVAAADWLGIIQYPYFLVFFVGGLVIALIGFADDRFDLPALLKFAVQIAAASWILFWFGGMPPLGLGTIIVDTGWIGSIFAALGMVWFFNLFNFMDGIDGMATSGTMYVTAAAALILFINDDVSLALLSALLCAATAGFVYFNWPPAQVFLGDAGSSFFSYTIAALILGSLWSDGMSLWTWLILLGYFVADTTVTLLIRLATVRKWYRAHRSHAYQNFARIWDDHLKVVRLVLLIEFLWLLPLAMLSVWMHEIAPIMTAVAFLPIVVFAVRNGPLREDG